MFDAGEGLGIGLARSVLDRLCLGDPEDPYRAGMDRSRPARLTELFPPAEGTDAWIVAELRELQAREAADAAYRAALVAELAARRPAAADPVIGRRARLDLDADRAGDAGPVEGVSEFFPDELALVLNCSRTAATVLLEQAWTLQSRLPGTWGALADGTLDWPRARALAAELGRPADDCPPGVVTAVEAVVLPQAISGMPVRRLKELTLRELLARDPLAADRRRELAARTANVTSRPGEDGMAELVGRMPVDVVAACRDTVDSYAQLVKRGGICDRWAWSAPR